jgi:hypothetical protein
MPTSGALTVVQEPWALPLSTARPGTSPSHLESTAPQQLQAASHTPKGRLLCLDPAQRSGPQTSLGAIATAGEPLQGPGETPERAFVPLRSLETFRESLYL